MTTTRTFLRNGSRHVVTADAKTSFLEVVRGELGIKTAGRGCANGLCGACRVLVEGEPVNTCTVTLGELPDGARVEGYEDLCTEPAVIVAVDAFTRERPTRCTLCVPALGVTSAALARHGQRGDPAAIDAALETAACMCTGRGSLRRALLV
jgi:aerobic-type carbon monoxide dehydrogenase small subunit (CoxS/CutS family)